MDNINRLPFSSRHLVFSIDRKLVKKKYRCTKYRLFYSYLFLLLATQQLSINLGSSLFVYIYIFAPPPPPRCSFLVRLRCIKLSNHLVEHTHLCDLFIWNTNAIYSFSTSILTDCNFIRMFVCFNFLCWALIWNTLQWFNYNWSRESISDVAI